MKAKGMLIASGVLGAAGIMIGAFGAHALPNILSELSPEELLIRDDWLQTGSMYHMYHAVALLALGFGSLSLQRLESGPKFGLAAFSWIIGIVVFSGCLYTMALTGQKFLGRFVPIGGLAFIIGWVLVLVGSLRIRTQE